MSEKILKTYIRQVLVEKILKLGREEYYVTPSQIADIQDYLKKKDIQKFSLGDAYENFLRQLQDSVSEGFSQEISNAVSTKYPPDAQAAIKKLLLDSDILNAQSGLFSQKAVPGQKVVVPDSILNVAEFSYTEKAGTMRGRGEFAIPLLFENAKMLGSNNKLDVSMGGVGWHVKGHSPSKPARMGSASSVAFSSTDIFDDLTKSGKYKAKDLSEMGMKKFIQLLPQFTQYLTNQYPQKYADKSEKDIYALLNEQARDAAIGDGAGICYYADGVFDFILKKDLFFVGATMQGRILLSPSSNKIVS